MKRHPDFYVSLTSEIKESFIFCVCSKRLLTPYDVGAGNFFKGKFYAEETFYMKQCIQEWIRQNLWKTVFKNCEVLRAV